MVLPTELALDMVWVSLEADRLLPLPVVPQFEDSSFRRIEVAVIRYQTNAAAVIDNNTDETHVAFVHRTSFGNDQDPQIPVSLVERTSYGIEIRSEPMPIAELPSIRQ